MKTKTLSFLFSALASLVLVSNSASAALLMCKDGEERQGSLEIGTNGRCGSGLVARGYGWKYYYCVVNETGRSLSPGFYQSCIRFTGSGGGNGYVTVTAAMDARFR